MNFVYGLLLGLFFGLILRSAHVSYLKIQIASLEKMKGIKWKKQPILKNL